MCRSAGVTCGEAFLITPKRSTDINFAIMAPALHGLQVARHRHKRTLSWRHQMSGPEETLEPRFWAALVRNDHVVHTVPVMGLLQQGLPKFGAVNSFKTDWQLQALTQIYERVSDHTLLRQRLSFRFVKRTGPSVLHGRSHLHHISFHTFLFIKLEYFSCSFHLSSSLFHALSTSWK